MTDHSIQHGPVAASATEADGTQGLRDQLMAELCGLGATMTAAMAAQPGFVPCEHAFGVVIEGLPAVMKQVCLLQICFRCTANMPNGKDGQLKSLTKI